MTTVSDASVDTGNNLFKNSALYQEFLAEREEILKHKWIESEKAGTDVGFEKALLDWIVNHRATWRNNRQRVSPFRANPNDGLNTVLAFITTASTGSALLTATLA
jgi:hypothetical protein